MMTHTVSSENRTHVTERTGKLNTTTCVLTVDRCLIVEAQEAASEPVTEAEEAGLRGHFLINCENEGGKDTGGRPHRGAARPSGVLGNTSQDPWGSDQAEGLAAFPQPFFIK